MRESPLRRARTRTRPYRQWRRARGGGRTPFAVQPAPAVPDPGPEVEFVYWHPQRLGVELAPAHILAQLREIHPSLSACRPPAQAPVPRRRWLIWAKDAKAQNPFCPGWYLVFPWEVTKTKAPLPLEPFSHLADCVYAVMASKVGGARAYFQRIRDERQAQAEKREATYQDTRKVKQREILASRRISNIGSGSKFALHHDGTIVPSRGEVNWARERLEAQMPGYVRQQLAEKREHLRRAGWIP